MRHESVQPPLNAEGQDVWNNHSEHGPAYRAHRQSHHSKQGAHGPHTLYCSSTCMRTWVRDNIAKVLRRLDSWRVVVEHAAARTEVCNGCLMYCYFAATDQPCKLLYRTQHTQSNTRTHIHTTLESGKASKPAPQCLTSLSYHSGTA